MITIFHIFLLTAIGGCFALGIAIGAKLFGIAGGIVGAIVGVCAGLVFGQLPFLCALRLSDRELSAKSSAELRADLRCPNCLAPNVILLELQSRGEDIQQELPFIVDMLVSEDFGRRGCGWAALNSAFPVLAARIPDYRISDSIDECRRKTVSLKPMN